MSKEVEELVFDLPPEEVTVGGDAPAVEKAIEAAPVEKDEGVEVDVALDAIQKDLDESRRAVEAKAREADEARRALAAEQASRAKLEEDVHGLRNERLSSAWHLANSELQQITNGIASVTQEKEAAKRDYELAFEANDAKAAAAAQERLAAAVADLRTLEQGKAGAENEVRRVESAVRRAREQAAQPQPERQQRQEQPAPKQQTPDDWISQVRSVYGSKPAEWLNEHKEFVTDAKLNQKMLKFAEYYQTVEEKPLNSADFISALNEKFFPQERVMEDEPKTTPKAPASKRAMPSAPVSNGASFFSSSNMDAKKVKLPPALARFADEAKLNKTLYAEGIVKDIKAGKLPKNYLDPDYPHDFV